MYIDMLSLLPDASTYLRSIQFRHDPIEKGESRAVWPTQMLRRQATVVDRGHLVAGVLQDSLE